MNLKDKMGYIPLHSIAEYGTPDCCLLLISAGGDVNGITKNGETPLITATYFDKDANVKCLIENGADVNVIDSSGRSALCHAAGRRNTVILKLLIEAGANVNKVDSHRKYSLAAATSKGYDKCAEILIRAGADVNADADVDFPALTSAVWYGYHKCVKLLLEAGVHVNDNPHALIISAFLGCDNCVKLLLEAGADVNGTGPNGRSTTLTASASSSTAKCPNLLMDALVDAVSKNRIECIKLLLQAGARVRMTAVDGYVLQCVASTHFTVNREIIRLLHAAGEKREEIDEKILLSEQVHNKEWAKRQIERVREYIPDHDPTVCLKDICRRAIREHLLQMSRVNMFMRIPRLGLPPSLVKYLLYNVSLD